MNCEKPTLLPRACLFAHTALSLLAVVYEKSRFGLLIILLHKNVLAAVGYCFVISALGMELSFITGYLLSNGASVQVENGGVHPGVDRQGHGHHQGGLP